MFKVFLFMGVDNQVNINYNSTSYIRRTYSSFDTVSDTDDLTNYPTELLNSLKPPGFPPHELNLKVGSSIIILRKIEPPKLCNRTRLVAKKMYNNLIEVTIFCGKFKGSHVFIPRIPLVTSNYTI